MIEQCLSFFYFIEIGLGVNLSVNVKRGFQWLEFKGTFGKFHRSGSFGARGTSPSPIDVIHVNE